MMEIEKRIEQENRPGKRLQHARLEKNYNLDHVAERLHLSKQQVESIERDDYTYVSALAFARGHLRLYAKLVDLPILEILKAFDALGLKEKTHPAPTPTKFYYKKKKKYSAKKIVWAVMVGAAFILVITSIIGFIHHHRNKRRIVEIIQTTPTVSSPENTIQIPLALPPDTSSVTPSEKVDPEKPAE